MPFEEFTQKGGRSRFGFPAVTVMRSGGLGLNAEAYRALGSPTAVVLAYDRESNRIGVRVAEVGDPGAYPVHSSSGDGRWVAAQSFLRYYDIGVKSTTRFRAAMGETYLEVDIGAKPLGRERRRGGAMEGGDVQENV